jgi:hypothetical protein
MDDHRTLDDFLEGPGDESDGGDEPASEEASTDADDSADGSRSDGSADGSGSDGSADGPSSDDVVPLTSTYQWTPDGATCADCGSVVERRWRDEDVFVCAGCKEW